LDASLVAGELSIIDSECSGKFLPRFVSPTIPDTFAIALSTMIDMRMGGTDRFPRRDGAGTCSRASDIRFICYCGMSAQNDG
jgi:hypothetical protein